MLMNAKIQKKYKKPNLVVCCNLSKTVSCFFDALYDGLLYQYSAIPIMMSMNIYEAKLVIL